MIADSTERAETSWYQLLAASQISDLGGSCASPKLHLASFIAPLAPVPKAFAIPSTGMTRFEVTVVGGQLGVPP